MLRTRILDDEPNSLSWIGFTDLFLHLFIFFLAGFMLLKHFAANEAMKAEIAQDKIAKFEVCQNKKGQCEKILADSIEYNVKNLMICRQQNTRIKENLQRCESEMKHEALRAEFGKIITQALNVLVKLKDEMESSLPIHIAHRPDRLFFDMGVSFKFNKTKILPEQKQAIINIGNKFREILDREIVITKPDGNPYYLYEVMKIVIEGHADNKKRSKNDNITNYRISKERAFAVMQLLIEKSSLKPPKYKISVTGYAEYGRPPKLTEKEKNNEKLARSRMRRVTISIVPDYDELLVE